MRILFVAHLHCFQSALVHVVWHVAGSAAAAGAGEEEEAAGSAQSSRGREVVGPNPGGMAQG